MNLSKVSANTIHCPWSETFQHCYPSATFFDHSGWELLQNSRCFRHINVLTTHLLGASSLNFLVRQVNESIAPAHSSSPDCPGLSSKCSKCCSLSLGSSQFFEIPYARLRGFFPKLWTSSFHFWHCTWQENRCPWRYWLASCEFPDLFTRRKSIAVGE